MQIEEAKFFSVLLTCGFRYDFKNWLESNSKKTNCDDIIVTLSEIHTDTDCVISELNRFIGDNKPDDTTVYNMLREFISERYKKGKMSVNDAMEALNSFVRAVGIMYSPPWNAMSRLCDWYGMVADGYKDYNAFLDAFLVFIENGTVPSALEIWNSPVPEKKISLREKIFNKRKAIKQQTTEKDKT